MTEQRKHQQFIEQELLRFVQDSWGMSYARRQSEARVRAEKILQWVTSKPIKRSWWRRLRGV